MCCLTLNGDRTVTLSAPMLRELHVICARFRLGLVPRLWLSDLLFDFQPCTQYGGVFSLAVGIVFAFVREGDTQLNWALYPAAIAVLLGSQQLISPTLNEMLGGQGSSGLGFLASWGLSSGPTHTGERDRGNSLLYFFSRCFDGSITSCFSLTFLIVLQVRVE